MSDHARTAAAVLIGSLTQGAAQEWPARPVTMVVPFTSGTTSDVVARALMDHLSKAIGQPIVIDNRGGAGGNIGAGMVAKAKPDGYTILLATTGPAATNKLMYKTMTFDPQRDFANIVLVGKAPVIIVARPNGPANSLQGLIGYAKANPDKVTAGFPGNGTLGHITGKLLQERSGIKFGGNAISRKHADHHRSAGRPYRHRDGFDGRLRATGTGRKTPGIGDCQQPTFRWLARCSRPPRRRGCQASKQASGTRC